MVSVGTHLDTLPVYKLRAPVYKLAVPALSSNASLHTGSTSLHTGSASLESESHEEICLLESAATMLHTTSLVLLAKSM